MWSSAWNLHQHSNIAFKFFFSHMNYVCVFIIRLHLWILHLCIQCDVQEMSQVITSKLNQLQIQIMYIHYAIIRRPHVYVKVCTLWLCLGLFSYHACTLRYMPRFSCLCRPPLPCLWLQRAPWWWALRLCVFRCKSTWNSEYLTARSWVLSHSSPDP